MTPPGHGQVVLDPATGGADYTPDAGFLGTDTFEYRICSPTAATLCATALVTVRVIAANHPPTVEPLTQVTTVGTAVTDDLTMADPDPGDTVTAFRGIPPRTGTATVTSSGAATYRPLGGFAGRDLYTVFVCDDGTPQLCSTGVVRVDVSPIARPDSATTRPGEAVDIAVGANDAGTVGPPTLATPPAHGTVTFSGTIAHYVPEAGFIGTDRFEYTVCAIRATDLCATTAVTVTIAPDVTPTPPPVNPPGTGTSGSDGGGALPATGSDVAPPLALGIVAVLAGAALRIRQRVRRRRS